MDNSLSTHSDPSTHTFLTVDDLERDQIPDSVILNSGCPALFSDSKLSILHMNIRSSKKNFDEFLLFLQAYKLDCDIYALTEAWHKSTDGSTYSIPGYTTHYNYATQNKCDGIIIFIKNCRDFKPQIQTMQLAGASGMIVKLMIKNESVEVAAIYRSPAHTNHPQIFIDSIRDYFESRTTNQNMTRVIVGDFNIDLLPENLDPVKDIYTISMAAIGLTNVVTRATREANTTRTCLDHIFINSMKNITSYVIPTVITDHYATMLKIKGHIINNNTKATSHKAKTDIVQFKNKIANHDWTRTLVEQNIETVANDIVNEVKSKIAECTVITRITSNRRFLKPWMTTAILNSIKKRDKMAKLLRNEPFNTGLRERYRTYRNKLTDIIRKRKIDYFKTKFTENSNDVKGMWKIIKQVTEENVTSQEPITLLDGTGNTISDQKKIADMFNNFFINVGPKLESKIEGNYSQTQQKINNQTLFLTRTSTGEIIKFINQLKSDSANGSDAIPARLLKETANDIAPVISHLINLCFEQGKFPRQFKEVVTIPVFKSGNQNIEGNYRPISLISQISKIVEKAIKVRIMEFLEHTSFLSKKQFGFRSNKSTQDAVYNTCKTIYEALDERKKALALFLDLQKVFDTIPHDILLTKLENAGIRGIALELLKDYLSQRTQRVRVSGVYGAIDEVLCGIPQGTVLAPLLFLIYINDFCELDIDGYLTGFADDASIVIHANTWSEITSKTNHILKTVKNWLDEHRLTLNIEKTKYIAFGLTNVSLPNEDLNITIHSRMCSNNETCVCPNLSSVKCIRYLGVIIDQYLKWDEHINQLTKKIRRTFYKFLRLRQILDLATMKIVYSSFVQSMIQYCILIWGGARKKYINKLFIAQKAVLKIMLKRNRRYPTEQVFQEAQIHSLNKLFVKQLIIHSHKLSQQGTVHNHQYNTRNVTFLTTPRARAEISRRFCSYISIRFYNRVPRELKLVTNTKKFSKLCEPWLRSIPNGEIDQLMWSDRHH